MVSLSWRFSVCFASWLGQDRGALELTVMRVCILSSGCLSLVLTVWLLGFSDKWCPDWWARDLAPAVYLRGSVPSRAGVTWLFQPLEATVCLSFYLMYMVKGCW